MQQLDLDAMLHHLEGDEELGIGRAVAHMVHAAAAEGEPRTTPFYSADERQVAQSVVGAATTIRSRAYGGYPRAKRQRLVIYPEFYLPELLVIPVAALEVTGGFETPPTTDDVLASLVGTGVAEPDVGDVVLLDNGCQLVVATEMAAAIAERWNNINGTPVTVVEIDLERLDVEPERVKQIRTTVASLRLDALAAAGFGTSRTKMARDIKSERVKVNWQETSNPAMEVKEGDVLSIKGRGRVQVTSVDGTTRKGRRSILLTRFM